jgi:hypothetical protein
MSAVLLTAVWGLAVGAAARTLIDSYTVIPVVLQSRLSSQTDHVGDQFRVRCMAADCGGFPRNTRFTGVITEAIPRHGNQPGKIKSKFVGAVLPDGTKMPIQAVFSTAKGMKQAVDKGHKAKSGAQTGGAAVGGIAGAILGGGVVDTLLGGAAGYLAGSAAKGKTTDYVAKPGAKFHIMLTQPAELPQ